MKFRPRPIDDFMPCHILVIVHCFIKSKVNKTVCVKACLRCQAFWSCWFYVSSRTCHSLPTLLKVPIGLPGFMAMVLLCQHIPLTWDPCSMVKTNMQDMRSKNSDELKANQTWVFVSWTPQRCHVWITSIEQHNEAVQWCSFQKADISVFKILVG